jgi:hypothetical protein
LVFPQTAVKGRAAHFSLGKNSVARGVPAF